MQLIGGPLDGTYYDGKVAPYIILGCVEGGEEPRLFACYKLDGDHFVFVSTKTRERLTGKES